jgi:hypothetical protein
VRAWGHQEHRVSGGIADQLINGTPTAKKVRAILGSNLQMAAVWADCARAVEGKGSTWTYTQPGKHPDCAVYENQASRDAMVAFVKRNASYCGYMAGEARCRHTGWHFTNVSLGRPGYAPDAPGAGDNDVVHAIAACIAVMQGGKPPAGFNIASKKEALRLLVHFVGDLHQPLHVGTRYLDDQGRPLEPADAQQAHAHDNAGGNAITLQGRKLHAVWDDLPGALTTRLLAGAGADAARAVPASSGPLTSWPAAWAGDTLHAAPQVFQGLKIGARSDGSWPATATEPAYRQARENLQAAQLAKAGARLAQLLTVLLP